MALAFVIPKQYSTGIIEPCFPTSGHIEPAGVHWIYEIKHDGFRFICRREGERVRVLSRRGHDWTDRVPLIAEVLSIVLPPINSSDSFAMLVAIRRASSLASTLAAASPPTSLKITLFRRTLGAQLIGGRNGYSLDDHHWICSRSDREILSSWQQV
jgi:hypothetical protein